VSAKTGEGITDALKLIEDELPRPDVAFSALLPYERGDLINRLHQHGEISSMEHTAEGTLVSGRANEDLAGELAAYAV
jgi:GTP-binding protein HflX